ncbi:MAG: flagellar basal body rod protein FlgB [Planctomycetota bacterium]
MTQPLSGIDRSLGYVKHALEVSLLRQQAIQSNLANASTPTYKRVEVKFESLLPKDVDAQSFIGTKPAVVRDMSPGRADGNNVEFDVEYANLEKNRLQFEALAEIASLRIQGMRSAIQSK